MVTIQLADGALDVGSGQELQLEVTAMRFSQGVSDAYTNDFELPKTRNNIRILGCYNLLDSPNQLYGSQIKPAILTVDGYMLDVHIQVVEVTDDAITVCLYQQILPNDLRDKAIRELIRDNEDTILPWLADSMDRYPSWFYEYDYGSVYDAGHAQYHPVKLVNGVIGAISAATGYTLPSVDRRLVMMAQNKYVCPQNRRQVISAQLSSDGGQDMCIVGGQHVVNDIEGYDGESSYMDSSVKEVVFNRDCSGTFKPYISWGKVIASGNNTFGIGMYRNGVLEIGWSFEVTPTGRRNGFMLDLYEHSIQVSANDVITFRLSGTVNNPQRKLEHLQVVLDFNWTDYDITDDDYGNEMMYSGAYPALYGWGTDGYRWPYWLNGQNSEFRIYSWDGQLYGTFDASLPSRAYSYMGYWCNISDITVGQLFWGLAWLSGQGVTKTDTGIGMTGVERTRAIEGEITAVRPSTERLGRRNYIRWTGEYSPEPVSVIDSEFLEAEHDIAELPFAYVRNGRYGYGRIDQYDITTDSDGKYSVSYSEIDGQVIMNQWSPTAPHPIPALVAPGMIPGFGFDRMVCATEVDVETFDDQVTDLDYFYLDGRKYMIISVSSDLNDRFSKITALLVPTT